ncbi:MAG: hypothetical protein JSS34_07675 [Proteobacteria bacterium]|nr:hypothetical protein [Pseudomonadota bacterium]
MKVNFKISRFLKILFFLIFMNFLEGKALRLEQDEVSLDSKPHLQKLLKNYKEGSEKLRKQAYDAVIQDLKENIKPLTKRQKTLIILFKKALWQQDNVVRTLYNYNARLKFEKGDTLIDIIDDLSALKEEDPRYEFIIAQVAKNLKEKAEEKLSEDKIFTPVEAEVISHIFDVGMSVLDEGLRCLIQRLETEYKTSCGPTLGEDKEPWDPKCSVQKRKAGSRGKERSCSKKKK